MAKRKFNLTKPEIRQLQAAFSQEKDGPTRTRYQAVRLYGTGTPVADIQTLTGCARSSLMEWVQKYLQEGLAGLQDHRGGSQAAKLTETQACELREKLLQYTPYQVLGLQAHTLSGLHWTVPDLYAVIKQWYGVAYQSRTSYLNPFATCGFSYQRTEKVFKSRREAQVLEFEAETEKN
jgi:transposase